MNICYWVGWGELAGEVGKSQFSFGSDLSFDTNPKRQTLFTLWWVAFQLVDPVTVISLLPVQFKNMFFYNMDIQLVPPTVSSNPGACWYFRHGLLCCCPTQKSMAVHFQPTFPTSLSCFYWWHFDGILVKCKFCALSRLSRWHLESRKHGLKDPIEAPLISPSFSRAHTSPLLLFSMHFLLLLPTDVSWAPNHKRCGSQPANSYWELVQEGEEGVQRACPYCGALQVLR